MAGAGLTFLSQLLLARSMGAAELGVYALAFSWCLLLANLSTLGFIPASFRFIGRSLAEGSPGYARGFLAFASRTTLLTSVAIASLTAAFTLFELSEGSLQTALLIGCGMVPLLAGMHLLGGFGNAFSNFQLGILPTSVLRPGLFLLLILICWLTDVPLSATFAMLLGAAAITLVAVPTFLYGRIFLNSQVPADVARQTDPSWLSTSSALLVAALFTGYFPELIVIVSGTLLDAEELAVLHVCLRLAMFLSFGLLAIDTIAAPDIARLHAEGDQQGLQQTVTRATRLRFWSSLAGSVAFALFGGYLLALFGEEFVAGYPILMVLIAGQLVQGAVGPVARLMGISESQNPYLIVFATTLILAMGLTLVLGYAFGGLGAAAAASLSTTIWGVWMRRLVTAQLGVVPRIF